MIQPEILYEDAQLIICYKPAGIATQTKKLGQKDMVSILLKHHKAIASCQKICR